MNRNEYGEDLELSRFRAEVSMITAITDNERSSIFKDPSILTTSKVNKSGSVIQIAALMQGRGGAKGEIGLAFLSNSTSTLTISQIADSVMYVKTLTKLMVLEPDEVLIPVGSDFSGSDKCGMGRRLFNDLRQLLPDTTLLQIPRKHFGEERGLTLVQRLCLEEYSSVELKLQRQPYCLAAITALIDYIQQNLNLTLTPKSLKIEYQGSEESMLIDYDTAKHIELMRSNLGAKHSKNSLFGVLNHCSTPGGTRFLRANLFQPPIPKDIIEERHLTVEELVKNPDTLGALRTLLKNVGDLEKNLSPFVFKEPKSENLQLLEKRITSVLFLKQALEIVPQILEVIEELNSPLLIDVKNVLKDEAIQDM